MAVHWWFKQVRTYKMSRLSIRNGHKEFCSFSKPFKIKLHMNCNSKNIIYLLNCCQCQLQYVGCTSNPLKVRIRQHLSDVLNPMALGLSATSRHFVCFYMGDLSSFLFLGIERVSCHSRGGNMKQRLLKRKAFWMLTLGTRVPVGLNIRQDLRYQI